MSSYKYIATLACMGIVVCAAGCQSTKRARQASDPPPANLGLKLSDADRQFAEALAYFTQGLVHEYNHEYDDALNNYQEAVRRDPNNEELHFRIAMGLLQKKHNVEAIKLMEGLTARKPSSLRPQLWLALIYRATDQTDKALATYKRLIKLTPGDESHYMESASLLIKDNRDKEAVDILEKGLGEVVDKMQLLRLLSSIHMKQVSESTSDEQADESKKSAIKTLKKALKLEPKDLSILYQLGDLHILNHDLEKAIKCFATIEEEHPGDLQIKQKLALSFIAIGDQQKAVESLEAIVEKDPSDGKVSYYLGELYEQMGETDKALHHFKNAATANPDDPTPYIKQALILHLDDPEKSVEILREGIERIPTNARLNELTAYTHFGLEQHEQAAHFFGQTITLKSQDEEAVITPNLYFSYGVSLQHLKEYDQAADRLMKAAQESTSYLEAYLQYLFRSTESATQEDGVNVLKKIAHKMENDARPYLYLGMAHSYLKAYGEAAEAYETTAHLLEAAPEKYEDLKEAMIYFWYAAACERDGQIERAEELFQKCLDIDPQQAEAYNYLAYMWAERGDKLDEALEYVQKALEINPDSGAFFDTLGWVYYMQGRYELALPEINKAAELIPDDATIIDHLGDVLHQMGKTEEALPHWQQAFVLEPENETLGAKLEEHGIDLEPLREEAEVLRAKKQEEIENEAANIIPSEVLEEDGLEESSILDMPDEGEGDIED